MEAGLNERIKVARAETAGSCERISRKGDPEFD
jgi:hypothetical protein